MEDRAGLKKILQECNAKAEIVACENMRFVLDAIGVI
jgi:hypothetical protein